MSTERAHEGDVIVSKSSDQEGCEQYKHVSLLILAAFHYRNEESLNGEGVSHNCCETSKSRPYAFHLVAAGWS